MTIDLFIDMPSGTVGMVGSAGAVGTAGTTGAVVLGTGSAGVAVGGGVMGATGTVGIAGEGVVTTGAGILAGALGIGSGDGAAVGGLDGGVTGTAMTGLGGVTEFIGRVRGGSEVRSIGGKNALPRFGSIVRPRGGSPVERSGTNFGAPTVAAPGPVLGAAPSKTDVVGEKIRGFVDALAGLPDSKTDVDGAAAGAGVRAGGTTGLALVTGMAGGVGVGIAGGVESLPKRRFSRPGFFCGSAMGSGMGVGAATVLGLAATGGINLGGLLGELTLAATGSSALLELIAFGVMGILEDVDVEGAVGAVEVFEVGAAIGALRAALAPFGVSGGMWLLSTSVKTSPDFMSLTSDWYDPSGWRSVFKILTCFSGPFSNLSVMTSPTFGGAGGASLLAPSASPTAAVIPNTPVQIHRFQTHRFMADSVQHAIPRRPWPREGIPCLLNESDYPVSRVDAD
jgi:hypothetical protein